MPTQTSTFQQLFGITLPTGQEIYDALMRDIEPELVSTSIPTLVEKYATETDTEKKARAMRYEKAFIEYDEAYREWITEARRLYTSFKKQALQSAEAHAKDEESATLTQLESSFA